MLDQREIAARRQAVETAVGSVRMEGLDVDAQTRADMERVALGELTTAEVIASIRRRAAAGEFGAPPADRATP